MVWHSNDCGELTLGSKQELDQFLSSVERRAFRMAEIATGNSDDALDILQDAMYKLVQKYASRDPNEWGPLFQTILQSRINDWHRRNKVRNRFRVWLGRKDEEAAVDPIQELARPEQSSSEQHLQMERNVDKLIAAIRKLSSRQQQVFMLRVWEGLDVAQTAKIMKCSQGSVKTHYSRAIHGIRSELDENWQ